MAGYRQGNPDRAKAAAAALVVHVAIGAAFLTGLVTNVSQRPSEVLQTFDVTEPPPPPIIFPVEEEPAPKGDPGEAGKKAEATPIVVPPPKVEVPARSPVAAAPVAGLGAAPSAGAATAGAGTGAGGSGTGLGGGGRGGSGIGSEARLLSGNRSRLSRHLLRQFAVDHGYAHLFLTISPTGRVTNCSVQQGTGSPQVDQQMCAIMLNQSRWTPARDRQGRPIAVQVRYTSTWRKN